MLEECLKPIVPDLVTAYVGIQRKQMYFDTPISEECKVAAEEFADLLVERIKIADRKKTT